MHVQITNDAGAKTLLLVLEFLVDNTNGVLTDAHLGSIEQKLVEGNPHIHCHATGDFLQFIVLLLEVQSRNRHLAGYCSSSVKVVLELKRYVVVFLTEVRFALRLSFIRQAVR